MNKKLIAIAVLSLACTGASAESLVEGSIDAGKAKAVVCGACHGIDGNSVNPEWPVLAGQHAKYTVKQLSAFKEGLRQNALMSGQAMALSEEDMRNLAVYFEAQTPGARSVADPDLVAKRLDADVCSLYLTGLHRLSWPDRSGQRCRGLPGRRRTVLGLRRQVPARLRQRRAQERRSDPHNAGYRVSSERRGNPCGIFLSAGSALGRHKCSSVGCFC